MHRRILSRALMISIVPLLLIGSVTLGSLLALSRSAERSLDGSRQDLGRDVVGRGAQADAVAIAAEIDRVLAERVDDVVTWSTSPEVRRAARVAAGSDGGDALALQPDSAVEQQFAQDRRLRPGSAIDRYLRDAAARQPLFSELSFTERNGVNVAASARPEDLLQGEERWWRRAWNDGLFLGDVDVDASTNGYGLTIASRIDGGRAGPLGVFRATVDLDVLQRLATRVADDTGADVTIMTGDGVLLAETASDHDPARIGDPDVALAGDGARTTATALASRSPGSFVRDDAVTGFTPVAAVNGRLPDLLAQYADVDARPLDWVAMVTRSGDATALSGLSDLRRQLSTTARTFAVIVLVTLLAALAAAFVVSARLAKRIVEPLRSLGTTARDIADQRLPALVRRAQAPDVGEDLPDIPTVRLHTNDEIEDVADAFNVVCSTAADLAADQARSRRSVARMFVSLGRRNQNLLSRQLEFIDRLERETSDPDVLEDLFRLDHLATRMRRNAESLLVLAGGEPPRRWAEPVPLADVVRGAVAEVEDYQRVDVDDVDEAQLVGSAVSDVTHLLAELIENAAQFSPPDTKVVVVGRRVVDGYSLAIVDDGVGMSEEQLADVNQRLETSPLVDRVPSSFLGLFVVGRLAARHGIRVRLVESTTEGVTAKVLLPTGLVEPPQRALGRRRLGVQRRPALEAGSTPATVARRAIGASVATLPTRATPTGSGASTAVDAAPPPAQRHAPTPPDGDGADDMDTRIDLRDASTGGPEDDGSARSGIDAPARPQQPSLDDLESTAEIEVVDISTEDARPHHEPVDVEPSEVEEPAESDDVDDAPVGGASSQVSGDADARLDGASSEASDVADTRAREPAVLEVRRRTSKRPDGTGAAVNGTTGGRAVLRAEQPADDPSETTTLPAPHPHPTIVADNDGIVLTPAEREARAARDRLARFQRAVQRGRAQSDTNDQRRERDDA